MLGAYNYDGRRYTSTAFMSIRQPYRPDGHDGDSSTTGLDWVRAMPGYRRNQHLWAGEHQKNYVPIRDSDGWVRRYWTDRDAYRQRIRNAHNTDRGGRYTGNAEVVTNEGPPMP